MVHHAGRRGAVRRMRRAGGAFGCMGVGWRGRTAGARVGWASGRMARSCRAAGRAAWRRGGAGVRRIGCAVRRQASGPSTCMTTSRAERNKGFPMLHLCPLGLSSMPTQEDLRDFVLTYEGLQVSEAYLERVIREQGPFDGLCGFSQVRAWGGLWVPGASGCVGGRGVGSGGGGESRGLCGDTAHPPGCGAARATL